jgi:hypothetical protein
MLRMKWGTNICALRNTMLKSSRITATNLCRLKTQPINIKSHKKDILLDHMSEVKNLQPNFKLRLWGTSRRTWKMFQKWDPHWILRQPRVIAKPKCKLAARIANLAVHARRRGKRLVALTASQDRNTAVVRVKSVRTLTLLIVLRERLILKVKMCLCQVKLFSDINLQKLAARLLNCNAAHR